MKFKIPTGDRYFEIPDEWWSFADMDKFIRKSELYPPTNDQKFERIPLIDIEPPTRDVAGLFFRKYKLIPVLFAFQSPECALPAIGIEPTEAGHPYKFRVTNGFHRYYASVAAGYSEIPAIAR